MTAKSGSGAAKDKAKGETTQATATTANNTAPKAAKEAKAEKTKIKWTQIKCKCNFYANYLYLNHVCMPQGKKQPQEQKNTGSGKKLRQFHKKRKAKSEWYFWINKLKGKHECKLWLI